MANNPSKSGKTTCLSIRTCKMFVDWQEPLKITYSQGVIMCITMWSCQVRCRWWSKVPSSQLSSHLKLASKAPCIDSNKVHQTLQQWWLRGPRTDTTRNRGNTNSRDVCAQTALRPTVATPTIDNSHMAMQHPITSWYHIYSQTSHIHSWRKPS